MLSITKLSSIHIGKYHQHSVYSVYFLSRNSDEAAAPIPETDRSEGDGAPSASTLEKQVQVANKENKVPNFNQSTSSFTSSLPDVNRKWFGLDSDEEEDGEDDYQFVDNRPGKIITVTGKGRYAMEEKGSTRTPGRRFSMSETFTIKAFENQRYPVLPPVTPSTRNMTKSEVERRVQSGHGQSY